MKSSATGHIGAPGACGTTVICMRPPVCLGCLRKTSTAKLLSLKTFHGTRVDAFAHEPWARSCEQQPVFPVDMQATGARQRPNGAPDELGGSCEVVRRASKTEEVTLVKGHYGAQLLGAAAYETVLGPVVAHQVRVQTPLAVRQLQPRAQRAADGVTKAARASVRAAQEEGDRLLKKVCQRAFAIELVVDILSSLVPHVARLRGLLRLGQVHGLFPSDPQARPGPRGSGATQRQNHQATVSVRASCCWLRFFVLAPRRRGPAAAAFRGWDSPTREARFCGPPAA